jgi:alpha-tubulin suppressor-like RCC1 family protein
MMARLTCILIASLMLLFCGKDKGADSGGNFGVTAIIYEPDGKQPAAGATVKLFFAGSLDSTPIAVDTTDKNGRYTFNDLPLGIYAVWAEKDPHVLFRDSVSITSSAFSTLENDTLECASSLTGSISVHSCHDPRIASILVAGSDKRLKIMSDDGSFTLSGLASGTYTLIMRASMTGYAQVEEKVSISPCKHDTMDHGVRLEYSGFPMVTDIRISQDTLNHMVKLSWERVNYSSLQDYVIYRDTCKDFNFSTKIIYATKDTFFSDTSYHPPAGFDPWAERCLEYRIAVRNDLQEIGPTCRSAKIQYATQSMATTFFTDMVIYPNPFPNCDTATINDRIKFCVTATNMSRSLVSLSWCDPFKKDTITTIDARQLSLKRLSDTIKLAFDTVGINRPFVIVVDEAGKKWIHEIPVTIITDPPILIGKKDTGVLVGANVHFDCFAFDRFGTITEWKWKIGSGTWKKTDGPQIDFIAPAMEGVTPCSVAVTDDDWNTVKAQRLLITSLKAQSVAACSSHSMILREDGTLLTFGDNASGQLGNAVLDGSSMPAAMMSDVQSMAAGCYHSLILTNNGILWSCGGNTYGQLGDGTNVEQYIPVPVVNDVQSMAAGYLHSLFLKKDKTLWACGWNLYGQLGDGARIDRDSAVVVMSDVKSMAAGMYHSLFLKSNGTAWACGENGGGQLGDGSTTDHASPVQVMSDVQSVAAGSWHSLFLKTDGTLWACGNNGYGQLGDGTLERRTTPVQVRSNVRSMATSVFHSLILGTDGILWVCGLNPARLKDTTASTWYTPVPLMNDVKSMAVGWLHDLILKNDGTVWACGLNHFGQLGNGSTIDQLKPVCIFPPQSAQMQRNW